MIVVETQKQHVKVGVIQSLGACIITIGVGTVVAPNINVVQREVLITSVAKLGSGLGGVSVIRNLSQILTLPTTTIGVIRILQMAFTNPITTIHVNMTTN